MNRLFLNVYFICKHLLDIHKVDEKDRSSKVQVTDFSSDGTIFKDY